jgi:hypothetical protein
VIWISTPTTQEALAYLTNVDWEFAGPDDAKAEIRAAVRYLLKDATGATRDRIALKFIEIVRQVANGLPAEPGSPLDDGMPSG